MRPSFHPKLINGPFDDPGLFIPFVFENRAILFDLGEIYSLSARDILKISHVFVTHTHMDHFAGFDRLLRLFLGRDKILYMYGPKGFLNNVEGKLAGYSWNLVEHYNNRFAIQAAEVEPECITTIQYLCKKRFIPDMKTIKQPFSGILHEEPALSVSAAILDHGIPCLGFTMKEEFHVNIIKDSVTALGLEVGPWLKQFKQALFNRQDPNSVFEIGGGKTFILGELAKQIARITPGQKITYITDVGDSESNVSKIIELAKNSDHLFIESSFLKKDNMFPNKKYHLTAWQAGYIAGMAKVKQFTLFHFSPRYSGEGHLLRQEAMEAYNYIENNCNY